MNNTFNLFWAIPWKKTNNNPMWPVRISWFFFFILYNHFSTFRAKCYFHTINIFQVTAAWSMLSRERDEILILIQIIFVYFITSSIWDKITHQLKSTKCLPSHYVLYDLQGSVTVLNAFIICLDYFRKIFCWFWGGKEWVHIFSWKCFLSC